MADFINSIDVFGDDVVVDSIIDRSIQEYHDDNIKMVGNRTFYGCTSLASVSVPMATTIGQGAFYKCSSIISMDLPSANSIGSYAFQGCSLLTCVILRNSSQMVSSSYPSFGGTPIVLGTGYIYVPSALIDSYKADSNWSKYANQFRILEEWTVDGTVTGELDLVNRHMVRFFNSDGTLLGYQIVQTGEDASYDGTPVCPEDTSAAFEGFLPLPTNVTTDMDCYAQYISFATASWDKIAELSESGKASEYFALGDEKIIPMTVSYVGENNTNVSYTIQVPFVIVHFGDHECSDGSIAGMTLLSKYSLDNVSLGLHSYAVPDAYPIGARYGWSDSSIRLACMQYVSNYLPTEVRHHIKAVKKLSSSYGKDASSILTETIDTIWIPSLTEYGESSQYTCGGQGFAFSYIGNDKLDKRAYMLSQRGITTKYQYNGTRSASTNFNSPYASVSMVIDSDGYVLSGSFAQGRIGFCI